MTDDRLFGPQRQERLMDELRRHGSIRVREFAALLGVSELTVRRDIAALADQNLLTKVRGGATLPTDLGPVAAALHSALRSYRTDAYQVEAIGARAAFYARCSVLEDMAYGIETGQDNYLDKSIAALKWLYPA